MQYVHNIPTDNFSDTVKNSIYDKISDDLSSVEKGQIFLRWVLTKVFHATESDADNGILDGPNDMGIDAVLEVQGDDVSFFRIFQAKYGSSHNPDQVRLFKSKMQELLEKNLNEIPEGRIRDVLVKIKNSGWDYECVYITDQMTIVQKDSYFEVFGMDQIISKLWNEIAEPFENKTESLNLESSLIHDKTVIGVISLAELGHLVNKTKKYIFESAS